MAERLALMASCLMLVLACGQAEPVGEAVIVSDSLGIQVVYTVRPAWDSATAWRLSEFPERSIGVVEGDESYLFFRIANATLLHDGRLVVAHSSRPPEFRIYDRTGTHIRSIGGVGEGPGEFRVLLGWVSAGDTLVGYDPLQGRITRFTVDGSIIDSRPIRPMNAPTDSDRDWPPVWFDRFGDGSLLGRPNNPWPYENGRTRPQFAFTRLDLSTLTYDTIALALGGEYVARGLGEGSTPEIMSVGFAPISVATPRDRTAFVSDNKDFWIEEVGRGGTVLRRFGRSFQPVPVTSQMEQEYKARRIAQTQSVEARRYTERLMREQVFADTVPAHGMRMIVDELGDLWVPVWAPESADTLDWSVFVSTGVYLGDVSIPRRFHVTQIGADAVVGTWRDELDVETVRVYRLLKPDAR